MDRGTDWAASPVVVIAGAADAAEAVTIAVDAAAAAVEAAEAAAVAAAEALAIAEEVIHPSATHSDVVDAGGVQQAFASTVGALVPHPQPTPAAKAVTDDCRGGSAGSRRPIATGPGSVRAPLSAQALLAVAPVTLPASTATATAPALDGMTLESEDADANGTVETDASRGESSEGLEGIGNKPDKETMMAGEVSAFCVPLFRFLKLYIP